MKEPTKIISDFTFKEYKQRRKILQEAQKYENQKKFKMALFNYQKALKIHESDFVLHNKTGTICIELKNYQKALNHFDRSLNINKKNPVALHNKGLVFYYKNEFQKAAKFFRNVLKLDNKDINSWHFLGHCYQEYNQHKKAINCFTNELKIDSSDDHTWCEKGNSLLQIGNTKNAKACYEKAILLNRTNNEAIANLGLCYYGLDKLNLALDYFHKAIDLDHKDGFSYHYLGHIYQDLKHFEESVFFFNKELKTNEIFEDTWYEIGRSHYFNNDMYNSKKAFLNAIRADKTNHQAASKLSQVFKKLGNVELAKKYREVSETIRSIPKKVKKLKLKHGETIPEKRVETKSHKGGKNVSKIVFIVHGHDKKLKEQVKKIIEPHYTTVILSERVSPGKTIIEEFEKESSPAEYAIALFTPDDKGKRKRTHKLLPRPRQNVIFELGFFIGKLTRDKAFVIRKNMEKDPEFSDHHGIIDIVVDKQGSWKNKLKRKLGII